MLNTIEDLEKEIDEFQSNMSASGEMVQALKQIVDQVKQQNSEFDMQSKALLARLDNLPSSIENTELANNERIRTDVASEFTKAIKQFTELQNGYVTALQDMKQNISDYVVAAREQKEKLEDLPPEIVKIENDNNKVIIEKVSAELEGVVTKFTEVNNAYKEVLEEIKNEVQGYVNSAKAQEGILIKASTEMADKIETSMQNVETQNETANNVLKSDVDNIIVARNKELTDAQDRYLKEMQHTSELVKSCEAKLESKYSEFLDTLEKMNISNLYEQNTQLKSELSKRTTLLVILIAISIVIGVIGLFI